MDLIGIGKVATKVGFNLMKIGTQAVGKQYLQEKMREDSNRFIRDTKNGVEHAGIQLKLIKRED